MKATLPALGLLAGAAVLLPTGRPAVADTVLIQASDPQDLARTRIRNGIEVLRATDEEHTLEQASFAFDPVLQDTGIVVMMSTGRLDGPLGPHTGDQIEVGNIQGACMPIKLVQDETAGTGITIAPQVEHFKYVSQRNSDENRAYHHPEVEAIGGGRFAITANWDRNNNTNTERYMQIVDSNCNLIQLTANTRLRENNTSALIMAKNNDNCSGHQAGGGGSVHIYADGSAGIMSEELCNGNGRDDGWANYLMVSCAADGSTCNVDKRFDVSVIDQEERSRGRCEQFDMDGNGDPETSVCCGTEGNGQPQREGVWCAGVDHASGQVLYKERVAYRGETADGRRTYAMRIKMLAERTLAGTPTGKVFIQYNMHRGRNNQGKKGGMDEALMAVVATPSRTGLNLGAHQDITAAVTSAQIDMTHATMFQTFAGTPDAPKPIFGFLHSNFNGNVVGAKVMNISLEADQQVKFAGVHSMNGPYDGQKYSKMLGNNPNDQGRNFTDCHVVANPFAALPGKAEGVPVLNLCALTGKLTSPGIPARKPDLFFEVWTSIAPIAPEPEMPEPSQPEPDNTDPTTPGDDGTPGDDTDNTDTPSNDSPSNDTPGASTKPEVAGCSVDGRGSLGGSGVLLLLSLTFVATRRRRRA